MTISSSISEKPFCLRIKRLLFNFNQIIIF
jgi:hypothetical protein